MPNDVDDAYQVYVNGRLIGEFGKFTKNGITSYLTVPRSFALPADIKDGADDDCHSRLDGPLHSPYQSGHGRIAWAAGTGPRQGRRAMLSLDWAASNRSQVSRFLEIAVLLLAMIVAAVLFWLARKEQAYLWLSLRCRALRCRRVLTLIGNYTAWIPASVIFLLSDAVLFPASLLCGSSSGDIGSAWAACRGCTKWSGEWRWHCA